LDEWASWLLTIPLPIFLAGGDHELKGVREASTDEQRAEAADLAIARFSVEWDFDLSRIFDADRKKLQRYILLFASL
jgi:hypothetical protein